MWGDLWARCELSKLVPSYPEVSVAHRNARLTVHGRTVLAWAEPGEHRVNKDRVTKILVGKGSGGLTWSRPGGR